MCSGSTSTSSPLRGGLSAPSSKKIYPPLTKRPSNLLEGEHENEKKSYSSLLKGRRGGQAVLPPGTKNRGKKKKRKGKSNQRGPSLAGIDLPGEKVAGLGVIRGKEIILMRPNAGLGENQGDPFLSAGPGGGGWVWKISRKTTPPKRLGFFLVCVFVAPPPPPPTKKKKPPTPPIPPPPPPPAPPHFIPAPTPTGEARPYSDPRPHRKKDNERPRPKGFYPFKEEKKRGTAILRMIVGRKTLPLLCK